jgi:hypothetical protein
VPEADIDPNTIRHLGAGEQRGRHSEAERFGGLEINHQLDFQRLLGTFQNAANSSNFLFFMLAVIYSGSCIVEPSAIFAARLISAIA